MKHLDLFSGIGGFALAAEMVWGDVEHVFCDNEPFAQAILRKHWPGAKIYGDIRTLTNPRISKQRRVSSGPKDGQEVPEAWQRGVDVLTGGFPCQPFSAAGRRRGTEDDRYLWPEMLRVIREFTPRWVIGENVGGLVTWSDGLVLKQVHADLEEAGYEVQSFIVPAVAVNAPHRRDRVWIVGALTDDPQGRGRNLCIGQHERPTQGDVDAPADTDSTPPHTEHEPARHTKRQGHDEGASARAAGSDPTAPHARSKRRRQESRSTPCHEGTHEGRPSQDDHESIGRSEGDAPDTSKRGRRKGNTITGGARKGAGATEKRYGPSHSFDWGSPWPEVAATLCRVDDGLPRRLDRNPRLKGLGNAIVPQVAATIMRHIREVEIAQQDI